MASANGIFHALDRKATVSQAAPERHTTIQRAAQALSRRNADAATVELFAEACQRLTMLAYEQDLDGYCNIDPVTWRLLIPAPWGRNGHARWGITPGESVVLREMMQGRQLQRSVTLDSAMGAESRGYDDRPPGLWLYDRARRCWRINLYDFDTLADGQRYWQRWPLGVGEYREARSRRVG